ncbi:RagB/SusD family nutrient uptake outer membrane protein [Flammeovirga sp. EKP202]|uniref:RagB/SusD family nutrient uptake outer membrane protein n=1 Tax=Flammeovirga sp. EKP202 TaxID=2770592 RepID=UPI00165EE2C4|nr:RagB/SusD family nutrient uptake outer membrane protein [Flammeovirga sp. EKP202]MBD0401079.1 RagB/SusD family nutrient uptake outer membrane protein [Flammeovirga sp. EKP202]
MKIKDILVAGSIVIGTMSITSCSDFLELKPTDAQTSETFFRTSVEAKQALVGIYEKLRSDYNGANPNEVRMFDMAMGDDAYVGGDPTGTDMPYFQDLSKFRSQTNNAAGKAAWDKCYGGIQRANTLLVNYDQIDFTTAEEDLKNNFKGEALFLRGHYYFELARLFENVPVITEPLAGDAWKGVQQATPDELYAQIAKDMAEAISLMAESAPEGDEGRLDKYAAEAELLKVFLFYTGYYGKSELPVKDGVVIVEGESAVTSLNKTHMVDFANDVITNSGAELATNYADLFNENGDYNKEAIFEIAFANTGSGDWGDYSYGSILCQMSGPRGHSGDILKSGWGFMSPSRELESAFEDGDLRKASTIIYSKDLIDSKGEVYQAHYNFTSMHTNKYTTHAWNEAESETPLNWGQNYHYIRFADVLLMAAELNLDTNAGKALEYLNRVRQRAGLSNKSSISLEDIQQERRVELALEGHRYFDVLRRGLDEAADEINVSGYTLTPPSDTDEIYVDDNGNNMTGDIGTAETFNVTFDKTKRGFLPIPQVEVDLHPTLIQNEGYR